MRENERKFPKIIFPYLILNLKFLKTIFFLKTCCCPPFPFAGVAAAKRTNWPPSAAVDWNGIAVVATGGEVVGVLKYKK